MVENNSYKDYLNIRKQDHNVLKLKKALYGLKQSPRLWYNYLASKLKEIGFKPITLETGIFLHNTLDTIILVYVDNILCFSKSLSSIKEAKRLLTSKSLDLKDLGEVSYFLGIEITRNREDKSISLC